MKKCIVYILLGITGGGKGTLQKILSKRIIDAGHTLFTTDTGAIFRKTIYEAPDAIVKINGPNRKRMKEIQDSGKLQCAALACAMWTTEFLSRFQFEEFIIMDGSPRKIEEWYVLRQFLEEFCDADVRIINVIANDEKAIEHMKKRNEIENRPETSTIEAITTRIKEFHQYNEPTIDHILGIYFDDKSLIDKYIVVDNNSSLENLQSQVENITLS